MPRTYVNATRPNRGCSLFPRHSGVFSNPVHATGHYWGEAVIYYGHVRLTGDVDVFYDRQPENAERLNDFWDDDIPGISDVEELTTPGLILQFGRPPNRIDLLNSIEGVTFEEAWEGRREVLLAFETDTVPISYIGIEQLIENKEAAGRPKDRDDLTYLQQNAQQESD